MNLDTSGKWLDGLSQFALAFFGGLIGALMRREASTWQTALLGAFGAGFFGLIVAKFCQATGVSDDMTFVFVGVSGWLGAARTMDFIERLLEKQFGIELPHIGVNPEVENNHKDGANGAHIIESREKEEETL